MNAFAQLLSDLDLEGKRIGVDADGYPGGYGYQGPAVSELIDCEMVSAKGIIETMMRIKSEEEIGLIRESCRWGGLAHRLLQEYTEAGLRETEISVRASHDASAPNTGRGGAASSPPTPGSGGRSARSRPSRMR